MVNTLLFSFFFGMPPIVAMVISRDFASPLARSLYLWGGLACAILAALFLVPLYLCDGSLLSGYTNCLALSGVFAGGADWLTGVASLYVLAGPAAALVGYLAELHHKRRATRT